MTEPDDDLGKSLVLLLRDLLHLRKDERLLICGDQGSDQRVIESAMAAGQRIGATTAARISNSLREPGEEPDPSLGSAMQCSDAICDFSEMYLCHTSGWKRALRTGARGYCIGNLSSEAVIRCIGNVDIDKTIMLGRILAKETRSAGVVRITGESGTDLTLRMSFLGKKMSSFLPIGFHVFGSWVGRPTGVCHSPGQSTYLSGQVSFSGIKRSISGTLAFDGSIWPPRSIKLLKTPIVCRVRKGRIVDILGDGDARILREWLERFNDPSMFDIVHFSYGFNPGARLSGCIAEDERVYGCMAVGIGSHPSHVDGVMKAPSIQMDGNYIQKNGRYTFLSQGEIREKSQIA